MGYINGTPSELWIEENHPENGWLKVYWKGVIEHIPGGSKNADFTLNEEEGDGLRYELFFKDGMRADGISRGWYPNGQLKSEYTWKDGKQNGSFTQWKETGEKEIVKYYKDGKHDGLYTEWYDTGLKMREGTYKDDEYDGVWTEWYENGQKKSEKIFKDGELISEINCNKDGSYSLGLWTTWYKNGRKKSEKTFKLGEIISEINYNKDGKINEK
jgi:antitoxin component YwqK of YwqJK toxin-antitoxin module|tara:strand:+ start:717 stop:1358 length:642 start_codon:yes stop_codon:yes gene_type:complete